jgi:hypothetical protein
MGFDLANPMVIGLLVIIVIVIIWGLFYRRENAVSINTTAGGPDNIIRTGVVASGQSREMTLPSQVHNNVVVPTVARAYPIGY